MTARKTCSKCKENKPLEMFHANRSKKDGLQPECKACIARRAAAYFARPAVKERLAARHAAYRARPDVKERAYAAKWYQQNRDWHRWRVSQNVMLRGGR